MMMKQISLASVMQMHTLSKRLGLDMCCNDFYVLRVSILADRSAEGQYLS